MRLTILFFVDVVILHFFNVCLTHVSKSLIYVEEKLMTKKKKLKKN